MSEWPTVRLGDYCSKIGSGATPRGGESAYTDDGISLIRSQNVRNHVFESEGLARINERQAEKLRSVTVQSGDVLLNITGDSVARCCLVPDEVLPARVNQHVAIVRPESADFDSRFVAYYLLSPLMQKTMLSLAGSGGTRKALTKEIIEDFEVPKPPLPAQERIGSFLSKFDELVLANKRRVCLLEQVARELHSEWMLRLRFPGSEHATWMNGVPEGWEAKKLGDLCFPIRESALPDSVPEDTPYIGLEHMPRRSVSLGEWGTAASVSSAKHRFRKGDILFGKIRPYFHKVGIAFVDGIASSDAIVLRPNGSSVTGLVLLTVSSDPFVAVASKTVKEGAKMPRADWHHMQDYPVLVPPDGLLSMFESTVTPLLQQLEALSLSNRSLVFARDLILPKVMRGELVV